MTLFEERRGDTGALATVTDSATGIKTTYYYDFTDRLAKYTETGANYSHSVDYTFDEKNNLTSHAETINGTTRTASFVYDDDNRIESMTADGTTVIYTRDAYGRLSQKVTKQGEVTVKTETFTYTPNAAATSGQVASHTISAGMVLETYTYTYDDNGNILSISDGTYSTTYVYDTANQLIRENNQAGGYTHTWTYDSAGNILTRTEYAYTAGKLGTAQSTLYYDYADSEWGDLLTDYGEYPLYFCGGLSYDAIGNLERDGHWNYFWERGRQLSEMFDGADDWHFTYNSDGLRTKRMNDTTGTEYTYVYNGSQLTQMNVGSHTLNFTYDASGTPLTVTLDGMLYYYVTNLQGDVLYITNSNGVDVARYSYDAWGVCTSDCTDPIGDYNPLRYRGYVYDPETELYYLQSRYYDPELGRFINADSYTATGQGLLGNNMFAYCNNNPVISCDPCGCCIHRLDFWNDCKRCKGKSTKEKTNIVLKDIKKTWNKAAPKIKAVGESIFNNIEISAGVGMGFEYEKNLIDFLGIELGMHGNFFAVHLEDGELSTGQDFSAQAAVTGFLYSFGREDYMYAKDYKAGEFETNMGFYGDDSLTIYESSFYAMIGYSFSAGFDIVSFIYDLNEIF